MIYPLNQICCLTLLAAFTALGSATPARAQAAPSSAQELIAAGHTHDRQGKPAEALEYYLNAEKLSPDSAELLTAIARQYRHMASGVRAEAEKRRLSALGLTYAQRAVAIAPNSAEANLSVAISHGKLMPLLGKKEQVQSSRELKTYVDRALALDPKNDMAWHVLGRWHQVISDVKGLKRGIGGMLYGSLPETTPQEAVKCYRQAITLDPKKPRHYIELGRTYAQMGDNAQARQYLEKGLGLPNREFDDPEIKAKGREDLAKLK